MILIDGVRYELWTPPNEEEFERVVIEHAKDIFGEDSIYFGRHKLESEAKIGSIPDAFVITLGKPSKWYIVEVELSTHDLYAHIFPQITKFMNAIKSHDTQKKLVNAIYTEINKNASLRTLISDKTGSSEVFKFIWNLISEDPTLAIVFDAKPAEFDEVSKSLPVKSTPVEFKTFNTIVDEVFGIVKHAHLFEPLFSAIPTPMPSPSYHHAPTTAQVGDNIRGIDELEIVIAGQYFIRYYLFQIPTGKRPFFPGYKIPFTLQTDIGEIETHVSGGRKSDQKGDSNAGKYVASHLDVWYNNHSSLKVGDKVVFKVVEPMKKYHLEIVK